MRKTDTEALLALWSVRAYRIYPHTLTPVQKLLNCRKGNLDRLCAAGLARQDWPPNGAYKLTEKGKCLAEAEVSGRGLCSMCAGFGYVDGMPGLPCRCKGA